MMKETAVIVFSGYNQRAIIAFCRVLRKYGIRFAIIASGEEDSIYKSCYATQVAATRESASLDREDIARQIRRVQEQLQARSYFIAPSTEALNRYLLSNREMFAAMDCIVPLVNKSTYERVSDKYSFTGLCRQRGIQVPGSIERPDAYPFVAKPKEYMSRTRNVALSPVIISNSAEHADFLHHNDESEYFYQQYIGGQSFYLMYYFSPHGGVLSYSQQNLVQQPGGKSIVAAVSSDIHEQAVAADFVSLFVALKYFGLVMVEVKFYQGEYYLIEANPRFWGPSQLFVDAGCRFFETYLTDFGVPLRAVDAVDGSSAGNVRYLWYGGMKQASGENRDLAFHDYNADEFISQLPQWMAADVYKREDTVSIFHYELESIV